MIAALEVRQLAATFHVAELCTVHKARDNKLCPFLVFCLQQECNCHKKESSNVALGVQNQKLQAFVPPSVKKRT